MMISLRGYLRPVMMRMLTWAELLMVQHYLLLCFDVFFPFQHFIFVFLFRTVFMLLVLSKSNKFSALNLMS